MGRRDVAAAMCCGIICNGLVGVSAVAGTMDTEQTISDLRSNAHTADTVMVAGYITAGDGGGGPFTFSGNLCTYPKTTTGTSSGTTVNLTNTSNLLPGMQINGPTGTVPPLDYIVSVGGSSVTLATSLNSSISSGKTLYIGGDSGTVIFDGTANASPNCYTRTSVNGNVLQFGADGTGTAGASVLFGAAFTAAQAHYLSTVVAGSPTGNRFYLDSGISIPANMTLQCPSPPGARVMNGSNQPTANYTSLPYTLLLPAGSSGIQLSAMGSGGMLAGCNVMNIGVIQAITQPPNYFHQLLAEAQAFTGTGVLCKGASCAVRDGMILGFNIGFQSSGTTTSNCPM